LPLQLVLELMAHSSAVSEMGGIGKSDSEKTPDLTPKAVYRLTFIYKSALTPKKILKLRKTETKVENFKSGDLTPIQVF